MSGASRVKFLHLYPRRRIFSFLSHWARALGFSLAGSTCSLLDQRIQCANGSDWSGRIPPRPHTWEFPDLNRKGGGLGGGWGGSRVPEGRSPDPVLHHQCISQCVPVLSLLFSHCCSDCCCLVTVTQCPTVWDPIDYSPPGSSVHEIILAGILEWVAISFSSSSWPRDQTPITKSCITGKIFTTEPPRKPH